MEFLRRTVLEEFNGFLKEDDVQWDFHDILYKNIQGEFSIILKEKAFVPEVFVFRWILEDQGMSISHEIEPGFYEEGEIFRFKGNANTALQIERTFLNLLSHFIGVSTLTKKAVLIANKNGIGIKIAATRKTYPGLRLFEKMAVYLAGGDTHRLSLKDMVMIKDNHIRLYGTNLKELILNVKHETSFSKKIEVEVENLNMLKEILDTPVDIVMLDNFSPEEIKRAVEIIKNSGKHILVEVSGGINLSNLEDYIIEGINIISMGSIIHSAPYVNISMEVIS